MEDSTMTDSMMEGSDIDFEIENFKIEDFNIGSIEDFNFEDLIMAHVATENSMNTGEPSDTPFMLIQESTKVQLTCELLKAVMITMYTGGANNVLPEEISSEWGQIWQVFCEEAKELRTDNGSITLLLDETRSIQQLKEAVKNTKKRTATGNPMDEEGKPKLKSDNQARYYDSCLVREAIEAYQSQETCDTYIQTFTSFHPVKTLSKLYTELYGEGKAGYMSDNLAISSQWQSQAFRYHTEQSYVELTNRALGQDWNSILWCTKQGRTALVKGCRKTMEDLVAQGAVSSEVVGEYSSHDEAENQALRKLGLLSDDL